MSDDLDLLVAASLDASTDLLPFLPGLLSDCAELGGSAEAVLELLKPLRLGHESRVLDLGCGHGAIAVACAMALGCHVDGVDGLAGFVTQARQRAAVAGCGDRCRFERADLRRWVRTARDYDVVLYCALGPMLAGRPCVEALRGCVRRGGYMVIDDGYLAEGVDAAPRYEEYLPHDESVDRLTAHGDVLVRELRPSPADWIAAQLRLVDRIAARAEKMIACDASRADLLRSYVLRQREECVTLRRVHVPATWLLQRA